MQSHSAAESRAHLNRANAQLSTGPRTAEGKSTSSLNALKTGLTGRTVLLHGEDAEAYRQHLTAYEHEYQPSGLRERELVQSLADTQWHLARIPGLEMAIYANGRCEFSEFFEDHDPALRPAMIELETFIQYEKQLRNLQLQESRLHRRYEKEMAELRNLQKERKASEPGEPKVHSSAIAAAHAQSLDQSPGFVFSTADIEPNLGGSSVARSTKAAPKVAA